MAYFGRKPKKPQSLPGSASGDPGERMTAGTPSAAPGARQARSQRRTRAVRSIRTTRNERKGR